MGTPVSGDFISDLHRWSCRFPGCCAQNAREAGRIRPVPRRDSGSRPDSAPTPIEHQTVTTLSAATSLVGGRYFILASIDAANSIVESNESNNIAASSRQVLLAPPLMDLTGKFAKVPTAASKARALSVPFTLQNLGGVPAAGTVDFDFFASTDTTLDNSDLAVATDVPIAVHVAPGKTQNLKFKLSFSSVPAGTYFLVAKINTTNSITESVTSNNVIISTTPIAIGVTVIANFALAISAAGESRGGDCRFLCLLTEKSPFEDLEMRRPWRTFH